MAQGGRRFLLGPPRRSATRKSASSTDVLAKGADRFASAGLSGRFRRLPCFRGQAREFWGARGVTGLSQF